MSEAYSFDKIKEALEVLASHKTCKGCKLRKTCQLFMGDICIRDDAEVYLHQIRKAAKGGPQND